MRRFALLIALVAIATAEPRLTRVSAQTRTLTVAAASDLQAALPEMIKGFEREAKATVTVSFGSSGNFFAQIQNGAPYDVYLSADIDYPKRLVASGHADASSLYQYATGRIVLWTRKDSGVDISTGLRSLADARVTRVAIANPKYAPYGRAAEAALRYERIYDAVRGKLVLGENISQATQFATSGAADGGIVAQSLALVPAVARLGDFALIPADWHQPLRQRMVLLKDPPAAIRAFYDYLSTPEAQQIMVRYGFAMPRD